jgi:uncharacterized repeat protein (TIGR04052 family)
MVLLACMASLCLLSACDRSHEVQLRFKLGAESEALQRVQFYVFDVELLRGNGSRQRMTLNTETPWQTERVALLDLSGPNPERRERVVGAVPSDAYTGVRFAIGVPFDLNHANPLTASAPLDRAELFWSWQSGYKFLRMELTDQEHAGAFHLGSTGCSSASALRPPAQPCSQPNVMRIELRDFDPSRQTIEVRVAELVVALKSSNQAACTGDYASDSACVSAFALTGIDPKTGACASQDGVCSSQRLFAVP